MWLTGNMLLLGILWCFGEAFPIEAAHDYCITKSFNGKCPDGEVINMTSAIYGRMEVGKCADKELGYGCFKDVLHILGPACSGKQGCSFRIEGNDQFNMKPCGADLIPYLQASHECIPVESVETTDFECPPGINEIVNSTYGLVSTGLARERACGDMRHPWRIKVSPGQLINITMINFHTVYPVVQAKKCKAVGYILETGHRDNVTICESQELSKHVYTSNGRHVDIYINTANLKDTPDFLLEYTVSGCLDLKVPPFAWYKREGDVTTIGCEAKDTTWNLKCEGDQWVGVIGQCPSNMAAAHQASTQWVGDESELKNVTIICIAVGCIFLAGIAIEVVVLKRREQKRQEQQMQQEDSHPDLLLPATAVPARTMTTTT